MYLLNVIVSLILLPIIASLVLRPINAELADFHGQRLGEKSQMVMDIAASLAQAASNAWINAAPYDKGRYTGIVIFEVASSFITVSKAGKLSKAEILTDIAKRDIDIPGGPAIKARAASAADDLLVAGACFAPGTLVLVNVNGQETHLPIEQLEPLANTDADLKAWAKCEHSGIEDWQSITAFFTTHTEELFDLAIDTNGDGEADETLTATGEHPFWVEDASAFIPMRELAPGMRLATARSTGMASVVGNVSKRGPPGEEFTTYNFEVAGFHTYFVGTAGIWVHNTCAARQMDLFDGLGHHARGLGANGHRQLEADRFAAMRNLRDKQFPRSQIAGQHWSRFAAENSKMMLADYRAGKIPLDDFPTVSQWNQQYFKSNSPTTRIPRQGDANVDVHHSVEKYIQEKLQIPAQFRDQCPGIPMLRRKLDADDVGPFHGGSVAEGGLAKTIQAADNIPTNMPSASLADRQDIVDALRRVYTSRPDWEDMWPVASDWLKRLQQQGYLDAGLIIPG